MGLVKQTLLCDPASTLDSVQKDLKVEIQGRIYNTWLHTNLVWRFNPGEHKRNELFDGEFKLCSRYSLPLPVHPEQPVNPTIPICIDLESSGRQYVIEDLAIEDARLETTPGLNTKLEKIERVVDNKFDAVQDEITELDGKLSGHMIWANKCLNALLKDRGLPTFLDPTLCDETKKLDLNSPEEMVDMDVSEDVNEKKTKPRRK